MENLVMRAKSGDNDAILKLIEILRPIRLNLSRKFYSLDSEDLNQELILILMKCIESYDGKSSGFPWYVRERSRFYCLEKIKERIDISIFSECEEGFSYMDLLVDDFSMEDFFLQREINDCVKAGIRALDPRERFVIFFNFFRDMSLSDISKKMGVSVSTVSKIRKKALRNLRRFLSDYK